MLYRTQADCIVREAVNTSLLNLILPSMCIVAYDLGYDINVSGKIDKDISLECNTFGIIDHTLFISDIIKSIKSITGHCIHNDRKIPNIDSYGRVVEELIVICGEARTRLFLTIVTCIDERAI